MSYILYETTEKTGQFPSENGRIWSVSDLEKLPEDVRYLIRSLPKPPWEDEKERDEKEMKKELIQNDTEEELEKSNEEVFSASNSIEFVPKLRYQPENNKVPYSSFPRVNPLDFQSETGSMTDLSDVSTGVYSDENDEDRMHRENRNRQKMIRRNKRQNFVYEKYLKNVEL